MSDSESSVAPSLNEANRAALLRVAEASVRQGLVGRRPPGVDLEKFDEALREPRATFVTLKLHSQLRGCIGTLEPVRPLVDDVAQNAYGAAFGDPRFPGVLYHEVDQLTYHISVLTPAAPLSFTSESDLLSQVRPSIDGLILEEPTQEKRGTFLPAVWETIPDPQRFLTQLKIKAGLDASYWSDTLRVSRYQCESIH